MSLLFSTGVIAASGLGGAAPGMVLLTPTSITHSGTSASIGANGQVTFTAVTSLSLNGVFSADFDNYVVSYRGTSSTAPSLDSRLRASGTDASGSNYTYQRLLASSTTVAAARTSSTSVLRLGESENGNENGHTVFIYGPFLAQPTAARSVTMHAESGARISDYAGTHSLSTSYDGITIFPTGGNLTGKLQVYGVRS